MAGLCQDECGVANTGIEPCSYVPKAPAAVVFVKMRDDAGAKNSLPVGSVLDQAAWDLLINEADPSQRFYPMGSGASADFFVQNVTEPTAVSGDFSAQYYPIDFAISTMEFRAMNASENYVADLSKALKCGLWGAYLVDYKGKVYGQISNDGTELYPKEIQNGTLIGTYNPPLGNQNVGFGLFKWTWSIANLASDARILTDVTANIIGTPGLVTVTGKLGTPGATTIQVTLKAKSSVAEGIPFAGLVAADFDVLKVSDDTAITISTVAETADGVYLITCTGSTGLAAYIVVTKAGYDFSSVSDLTFTFA